MHFQLKFSKFIRFSNQSQQVQVSVELFSREEATLPENNILAAILDNLHFHFQKLSKFIKFVS